MNRVLAAWKSVGQDSLNLPNVITLTRILLIPVFVVLFATPTPDRSLSAALIFIVAAFTDLLDGYLARRNGQVTTLGSLGTAPKSKQYGSPVSFLPNCT